LTCSASAFALPPNTFLVLRARGSVRSCGGGGSEGGSLVPADQPPEAATEVARGGKAAPASGFDRMAAGAATCAVADVGAGWWGPAVDGAPIVAVDLASSVPGASCG